jgi:hypothetical protein
MVGDQKKVVIGPSSFSSCELTEKAELVCNGSLGAFLLINMHL